MSVKSKVTEESAPKKRLGVRTLSDAGDAKRLVARLVRATLADDLDPGTLRAVTGALQVFLKACELSDLEDRLAIIEGRLAKAEAEDKRYATH